MCVLYCSCAATVCPLFADVPSFPTQKFPFGRVFQVCGKVRVHFNGIKNSLLNIAETVFLKFQVVNVFMYLVHLGYESV
jgi:hypothetical protein